MTKQLLRTRTFWANLVAMGSMIAVAYTGVEIPPEFAVSALAVINVILRIVTKEAIDWS